MNVYENHTLTVHLHNLIARIDRRNLYLAFEDVKLSINRIMKRHIL